ncbi:MAG: hypothetical protein IT385_09980 [Deltaproteobacteria bacterium]|nr:hypothetical protein [Deltaproteobacteria bacterium]
MSTSLDSPTPPAPGITRPKRRRRARGLRARLSTLVDLGRHFSGTRRLFLLPMIVIFLLAAVALVVIQIVEYAAPFVYTLF